MQRNVGDTERVIRILAGTVILWVGFFMHSWWGLIGFVPILTGAMGYCPPYAMLGINTCKTKEQPPQS